LGKKAPSHVNECWTRSGSGLAESLDGSVLKVGELLSPMGRGYAHASSTCTLACANNTNGGVVVGFKELQTLSSNEDGAVS
jgi:hypothetical protein